MDAVECLHNLDLNKHYLIYKNVHEMLIERGYEPIIKMMLKKDWLSQYLGNLADMENPDSKMTDFKMIDSMSILFKKMINNKLVKLLVYFYPLDSKLSQKDMICIHSLAKQKKAQHLVIIVNTKATPKVANVIEILGQHTQLFTEEELCINPTKHQLVPKHELCSGEEREKIINAYAKGSDGNLLLNVLPGLLTTDPIAKWYNYAPDDLIKIYRPRPDGYFDITYRIVSHPMNEKN